MEKKAPWYKDGNFIASVLLCIAVVVEGLFLGTTINKVNETNAKVDTLTSAIAELKAIKAEPMPTAVVVKSNKELQNGKPFVFISPNRQHPVVRTMALGFWEACEALKVDCKDYSFDGVDLALMATGVDQIIAQGASGAIAFVDQRVYNLDNQLIAAGIPTDCIHVKVKPTDIPGLLGWVATDATDYAKRSALFIGEKIGGKGTVVVTQGDLNDVENEVTAAFTAEMKAKYPNVVVLPPEMEGFDPPQAIAKAAAVLQAHPDLVAAFGTTGGSPTTWAKALEQTGFKKGAVIVVGMDYTRQNLDLVKEGWVTAVVGQPLYEETYKATEMLMDKLLGKPVNFDNPYPAPIITAKDVDKYYGYADRVDQGIHK